MVRRTKQEALETREAIFDAAVRVFYEKGVAKAGLEEIAELAGVTRGAVYWHFKNKVDLFEALHDTLHQPFMETILQDLENDHPEPLKQLEELCVNVLLDVAEDQKKQRILSIFLLKCDYSGEMEDVLKKQNQQKEKCRKLFDLYFDRAIAKGHINTAFTPEDLSTGLSCYFKGIILEFLRAPDEIDLQHQAPQLIRQFFYGLYAR